MAHNEIVRLTNQQFSERQGQYVAGPAWGLFPMLNITDWPTDHWTFERDGDEVRLHPARVLNEYTVTGVVDTRDGGRTFYLATAISSVGYDAPAGPTGAEGIEPWVEIVAAADITEAVSTVRAHAEA